tara:strand:+ start:4203 stop:5408 length:1206 start_codon:yes stop_codon:yes gene_type:complete
MYLEPDPNTYAKLPGNGISTARIICDVYTPEGEPFEGDPRYILKKVLKEAGDMGYRFLVGPDLEFYLFEQRNSGGLLPATHDVAGYFDFSPRDLAAEVRKEMVLALQDMGLDVEMSHHECGPGQHEIDYRFDEALVTADRAITFKQVVKSIANEHDLYATFMAKPIFGEAGSGMHAHQNLADIDTGKNVFPDEKDEYGLSEIAKSFIAGQLKHVKGFCAVTAPTVNSYKRLVAGYEAPVHISWAGTNRSALIRIPRYSPGKEQSTRAELRCPDPSCNPYLAFAVMLKAGLDGIKRKLTLPEPVEEDVYLMDESKRREQGIDRLPGSLGEAIEELERDKVIREALGPHTFQTYVKAKTAEWEEYKAQVTKLRGIKDILRFFKKNKYKAQVTRWEHNRYFEVL